ncbi:MAG: thioredoxin-dependent thiol peroxidase [Epsilonproteobacteria bacterium]|nr:thioredoxin-dependent thiol peroxidase [Campylobacterota bacterium]
MLKVGDKVEDFCLENQDGVEICLRDLSGKWVVVYFYPKASTPGCTTEACDFTDALEEFNDMDAVVLGISADSVRKLKNFAEKKELKITLLSDEEHKVLEQFGVWQLKKNYGREYMGIVRSTFIIDPDGIIRAVWEKVRVKGHVEEVKQKLKELQNQN